jgi:hypothetical protein
MKREEAHRKKEAAERAEAEKMLQEPSVLFPDLAVTYTT